jgi:hypothetical protein
MVLAALELGHRYVAICDHAKRLRGDLLARQAAEIAAFAGCLDPVLLTDLDGRPINFGVGRELSSNRGMIVAREGVHGKIVSAVAEILKA